MLLLSLFETGELEQLQDLLGYHFQDLSLLARACIRESFINEESFEGRSNERMEFLGDSVLGFIIADILFHKYPQVREGVLAQKKAVIVSTDSLSKIAVEQGFTEYIKVGRGEDDGCMPLTRQRSLNADFTEALIAAIYLDGGNQPAYDFIARTFHQTIENSDTSIIENYKTQLQEFLQARYRATPTYKVISSDGPSHDPWFSIEVYFFDVKLGIGQGGSKREASQDAAYNSLQQLSDVPGLIEKLDLMYEAIINIE